MDIAGHGGDAFRSAMLTLTAAVLAQALASTPSAGATPSPSAGATPSPSAGATPSPSAGATPSPTQPAPPVVVTHEWYGYQTLAIDVPALTLGVVGVATGKSALLSTGVCLYVLGPPLVHVAHGHFLTGMIDAGARVILPVGFAAGVGGIALLVAFFAFFGQDNPWILQATLVAGGVGLVGAVLYDALGLSSRTEVHYPDHPRRRDLWSLAPFVAPTTVVREDGQRVTVPMFGVGGAF